MNCDLVLVTFSDVVPEAVNDFNRWYNEQHLPEYVSCPGIPAAARFEAMAGEPQFLALYALDSEEALSTPEIKQYWGWGPMWPHLRTANGRVYRRTFALGAEPGSRSRASEYLLVTTADVAAGSESDFDAWYNDVHLPEILACPGFGAASRYECIDGEPRYLAMYEIDRADALKTPEMRMAHGWGPAQAYLRNFCGRFYRRTTEVLA